MRKFTLSLPYTNAALVPKIHLWTIDNEPIKAAQGCGRELPAGKTLLSLNFYF
jgi:hypothetical protein